MSSLLFENISDEEFLSQSYLKSVFLDKSGSIGQAFLNHFQSYKLVLETLGSEIRDDLFIFRDGVACKKEVYFDEIVNKILWEKIWKIHDQEGGTIYLRGLQKYIPDVANYLKEVTKIVKGRTPFANIFITPKNSVGLNAHFDPTEFIVFQIEGEKKWDIWPAPIAEEAEKMMPEDMAKYCLNIQKSNKPTSSYILRQGDALYLPLYSIHSPETFSKSSCHITIGLAHSNLWGREKN
ncbi:JmjC domain-containing protein [Roseivirga pacifica]|uniref:JmjC domain-containing protein n=1 Tax=Roseivirga pacifica TaxID=1267423 RepID=UPI00227D55C2|nr:cupin domain-containing protein [Roseivirga pacifica]